MRKSYRHLSLALSSALALSFTPALAHEFWIDPVTFTPAIAAEVPITFRIGSDFKGSTYPYVRALDRGFQIVTARGARPIKAVDGDDPASDVKFGDRGLAIVWHRRAPEPVAFETMAAFEETLVDEGLETIALEHRAAGRPLVKIRELFSRCAKALLQVGGGRDGQDRAVGMPLELVAGANPYAHPKDQPLPIQVLLDGKPLAGAMVKVFNLADRAQPRRLRSDVSGRFEIDASWSGEYLVSVVHMKAASPSDKADYVSHWASLTFARGQK